MATSDSPSTILTSFNPFTTKKQPERFFLKISLGQITKANSLRNSLWFTTAFRTNSPLLTVTYYALLDLGPGHTAALLHDAMPHPCSFCFYFWKIENVLSAFARLLCFISSTLSPSSLD